MRWLLCLWLGLVAAGCSGWHSSYKCQGYPEGVQCMSVREVYARTNYAEALAPDNQGDRSQPAAPAPVDPGVAAVQGLGYRGQLPLRTPAQVIRSWVAPWESQDGSLHLPSYLYAEVEKRQWAIGEGRLEVAPAITPLEVVSPPERGREARPAAPRQPRQGVKKDQKQPLFPDKLQTPPRQNQNMPDWQKLPGQTSLPQGGGAAE